VERKDRVGSDEIERVAVDDFEGLPVRESTDADEVWDEDTAAEVVKSAVKKEVTDKLALCESASDIVLSGDAVEKAHALGVWLLDSAEEMLDDEVTLVVLVPEALEVEVRDFAPVCVAGGEAEIAALAVYKRVAVTVAEDKTEVETTGESEGETEMRDEGE
jgi:hypothetical protein